MLSFRLSLRQSKARQRKVKGKEIGKPEKGEPETPSKEARLEMRSTTSHSSDKNTPKGITIRSSP